MTAANNAWHRLLHFRESELIERMQLLQGFCEMQTYVYCACQLGRIERVWAVHIQSIVRQSHATAAISPKYFALVVLHLCIYILRIGLHFLGADE